MKRWFQLLAVSISLYAHPGSVWADTPDDQYVEVYQLIQAGDGFKESGQPKEALEKYLEAQRDLKKLQAAYPSWNDKVVKFRLTYLAERITPLMAQFPKTTIPVKPAETAETKPELPGIDGQINILNNELIRLRTEKGMVELRLKEALAAQPRTSDPREMARAEEKISALEKERDLAKVSLEQERRNLASQIEAVATLTKERDTLQQKMQDKTEKSELKTLRSDNDALKKQVADLSKRSASLAKLEELNTEVRKARTENDKLRVMLADAEKKSGSLPKLNDLQAELKQTRADVKALQTKNTALEKDNKKLEQLLTEPVKQTADLKQTREDIKSLQAKNENLEKENKKLEQLLTEPVKQTTAAPSAADTARVAALQKEKAALEKEKIALDKRNTTDLARLKSAERERDDLEKKLAAVTRELNDRKKTAVSAKGGKGPDEASLLRAKLDVYEAKKIPYTLEEQALFKKADVTPVLVADVSAKVLPAGTATLIADAQRAFAARRYDEAEKKYLQVLSLDEKNVFTLANLAAIQLEQGRFDDAEGNVKKAIALDANDGYSQSLLGLLKFRQNKLDDAVDALSRAAQLDPKNAETQNYLGLTLSQKGQRGPAEAAFRKAIQLSPGYSSAHHNLAVHYATQQPPTLELARWHYQKAISSGHPKNADLEKLLGK